MTARRPLPVLEVYDTGATNARVGTPVAGLPAGEEPSAAGALDANVREACCEACALAEASVDAESLPPQRSSGSARVDLPAGRVLDSGVSRDAIGAVVSISRRRTPVDRSADRRITLAGVALSAGFIALAIVAALLPVDAPRGAWLPVHLVLAGAATVAIGAVLPFFVAALTASPPAPPGPRTFVVALLTLGALGVSGGVAGNGSALATAAGLTFVSGLVGLGLLVVAILRGSLGSRRGPLAIVYPIAVAEVIVGASIGTLYVAGWSPVLEAWGNVKPAHAWLNLFGFVSLVVAATLVHLFPTVVASRIAPSRLVQPALTGLALGPIVVATGYLMAAPWVVGAGAVLTLASDVALLIHLAGAWRRRSPWTTDPSWHLFTGASLGAAAGWQCLALLIAALRTLLVGGGPASWSLSVIVAPMAVGFVLQSLVGSWTHLLPAIGPGDQARHAAQRRTLALGARTRLFALNAGTALLSIGIPFGVVGLTLTGALVSAASLSASLCLFARAVLRTADPAAQPFGQVSQVRA